MVVIAAVVALAAAAVATELREEPGRRTWHGRVLGVPYDFRRPTRERVLAEYWDPRRPQLLTPHAFGLGWGVNFARVVELLRW
jgi:hypothetical protein